MTRLFADDSSLFYASANIADIDGIINHDLQMMSNWAKQWLVTFNPLKTEAVLFTLKKLDFFPHLIFDNVVINFVDSHKHLGVTISSNDQRHTHIENISRGTKVEKMLTLAPERYTAGFCMVAKVILWCI